MSRVPASLGKRVWFLVWALVSAFLMTIGAFGPWVGTWHGPGVGGTDGSASSDPHSILQSVAGVAPGWLVFGSAVAGAPLVLATRHSRGAGVGALLGGLSGAAVSIHDRSHMTHLMSVSVFLEPIHVGWGLNLAMAASISLTLCGLVWLFSLPKAPGVAHTDGDAMPSGASPPQP
jgi:hypothetical protein